MELETPKHTNTYIRIAEMIVGFLAVALVAFLLIRGGNTGSVKFTRDSGVSTTGNSVVDVPKIVPPPKEIFVVADTDGVQGSTKENIATANPDVFKAAESFKSFDYDASKGKVISLSGTCRDSYYAVLVFDKAVDYRKNPAAARYNSAYPCSASHLFSVEVNLKDANLSSGEYYIFVADQGSSGSWYNPR